MKKSLLISIFIMTFVLTENVLAAQQLRQPQGRLGTSYKTEKYNPNFKSNLTKEGLSNLYFDVKEDKKKEKAQQEVLAREQAEKQKLIHEQKKQELAKQKAEQEAIAREQAEKQKLIQEQKKQELAKQKAEQEAIAREQQVVNENVATDDSNNEKPSFAKKMSGKTKTAFMTFLNPNYKEENEKTAEEKFIFFKKLSNKEITEETNMALSENKEYKQPEQPKENVTTVKADIKQDPATKLIVNEISTEITNERSQMLEELSLLWVSAVQKSDTVYFAIMKLSNPNGEEVNKSGVKKILAPIISAAPLVGQAFVNPALSAGSLIGSNLMGTMINDSANSRLTKVNDADLVILARSIDELQETLLLNYLAYKNALKEYELSIKITDSRKEIYDKLNAENSPNVILANTFYTEALDNQYKARQEFLMKRVVLEQMVGTDALNEMEKKTVSLAE